MDPLILYGFPRSCSRVIEIALLRSGASYDFVLVRLDRGEHIEAPFLARNPWAKVPVLAVGDRHLSEIPAILHYLTERFPEAGLMPAHEDPFNRAAAWATLSWCSSTLHPLATRVRRPAIFAGAEQAAAVRAIAGKALLRQLRIADRLLTGQPWLLGADWSLVDAYLHFIVEKAEESGIDLTALPNLADHVRRSLSLPDVARAMAIERGRQVCAVQA